METIRSGLIFTYTTYIVFDVVPSLHVSIWFWEICNITLRVPRLGVGGPFIFVGGPFILQVLYNTHTRAHSRAHSHSQFEKLRSLHRLIPTAYDTVKQSKWQVRVSCATVRTRYNSRFLILSFFLVTPPGGGGGGVCECVLGWGSWYLV